MAEQAKAKKGFLKDFKSELKRVIWPNRKQTVKNTLAVIFIVILVSVIVVVLDFIFIKGRDFAVDKVTGGKVTAYKQETIRKQEILDELVDLGMDQNTASMYGYFYGVEQLEEVLAQVKNGEIDLTGSNEQTTSEGEIQEGGEVQPQEETTTQE